MSDLEVWASKLKLNNFRGVFRRELLPHVPRKIECGIINLGNLDTAGTHWTCYYKNGKNVIYFDSYGNAPPPLELEKYMRNLDIRYNSDRFQDYGDPPICGHLCLEVLRRFSNGITYDEIKDILNKNKYAWLEWFD